ncbi:MAG: autotransporter domain-containing protein, partial [Acidobacteriota bacterium]
PPILSISDVAVDEGDEGTTAAVFRVDLSMPSEMAVSVGYETADGTAVAGEDYEATSGTLTFAPGQTLASLQVAVFGDTEMEADELFAVNLFQALGAVIGDGAGRGVIRNDDGGEVSRVRFVTNRQSVMEGGGTAEIALERIGSTAGPAQVAVSTVAGTAQPGQDFQPLQTVVRWLPGEQGRKTVTVGVVDDNRRESDEALGLRLSQPLGTELAAPTELLLTIIDDDTPLRLEAVGDQEVTTQVRQELDLQVRAARADGSPVAGATILWQVQDNAERVGPAERPSDDEGISTVRLRAATRPGQATAVARLQGTDSAVAFALRVEGDLGSLPGGGDNDGEVDVGSVLDQGCTTATGDLLEACEFLFGLATDDERRRALDELTPRSAVAQGNAALRAPRVQLRNVGSRLNALRGGSSARFAADQLGISIRGDAFAVGTIRQAKAGYRVDEKKLAHYFERVLLDQMELDRPRALAAKSSQRTVETESPWGFFVNGRISFGEAPQTGRETGYDFETQGVTAGVDYRLNDRFVLGAGIGYLATDVDLTSDGGDMQTEGVSLSLYTTYYTRRFYLDGIVAYGKNDYEMTRFIDLPRPFRGATRQVARGEPEGDQLSIDLAAGYDFQLGAANLGGFVRASFVDASIDRFSETGAGPFDLLFSEQQIESLQGEIGLEISRPFSLRWGVVQPSLRVAYLHEFEDDRRLIRARFRSDLVGRQFVVVTDTPDRDFFNVGAGITVTLPRSMATYLIFDTDLARDDLDIYTLSGGFRFQF